MEYEVGKWYGWNGGECPVHPDTVVEVEFGERSVASACRFMWDHTGIKDIIAFRIIKPYVEQKKEYTIDPRKHIIWYGAEDDLVHVWEV